MMDLGLRPVELACMLGRLGARFVVVGSSARMLTTGLGRPKDLDIVVEENELPTLVSVLSRLMIQTSIASLMRGRQVRLESPWGPLDVFVDSHPASRKVGVGGVLLSVTT